MAKPSYAYLKVASASGNFTTSYLGVFDEDNYSGDNPTSVTTSDITYTSSSGELTFSESGAYHILLTQVVQSDHATAAVQTVRFTVNGVDRYEAQGLVAGAHPNDYDPVERSFQTILEIAQGDVLVVRSRGGASGNINILAGSTLVATKITSNVYGHFYVSTVPSAFDSGGDGGAAYNPFDLDGNPGMEYSGEINRGITYKPNDSAAPFHIVTAGRYVVAINHIFKANTGANNNIVVIKQDATALLTQVTKSRTVDDPTESTTFLILDLPAGAAIGATWDWTGTDGGTDGIMVEKGTSFCIYKLSEDDPEYREGNEQNAYITVTNNDQQSNSSATIYNPFDEDNYSSANFKTFASKGISFNSGTGEFKIDQNTDAKTGYYWAVFAGPLSVKAGNSDISTADISIKVNGTAQLTIAPKVDTAPDPLDRTASALLELSPGDVVTVTLLSNNAQELHAEAGCTFSLHRVAVTKFNKTSVKNLIGLDNTINTFAIDNLSAQHAGSTSEQAPFSAGVGLNLRGRTPDVDAKWPSLDQYSFVSIGDKKN